jgi:hypothetical protein
MSIDAKKRKRRKVWLIVLVVLLLPVILFPRLTYFTLNAAYDLIRFAKEDDDVKQHKYSATSMENLKALHQAVSLYYESEGVLPEASGWMDAAKTYVRTNDLKKGEEMKKFVNPRIPAGDGVFGYAFNSALSMVYMDEVKDPASTPMIFESKDTKWNAFGDPRDLQPDPELSGGNNAVTVEGNAVLLRDLLQPEGN